MTRDQAKNLIETYCVDEPTAGATERLLDVGDGYPGVRWTDEKPTREIVLEDVGEDVAGFPGRYLVIQQAALDEVLYGEVR